MFNHLNANWSAPKTIKALTTTRFGGKSQHPYHHNNLAHHVGDVLKYVQQNRAQLIEQFSLPSAPFWLEQTHSIDCITIDASSDPTLTPSVDASVTRTAGKVLAILTADCLPITLCNQNGDEVAAIHAGWRGLANGIIQSTLSDMESPANELMAWIGPAICEGCYETGAEVETQFIEKYPFLRNVFRHDDERIYANLPLIAELILRELNISSIFQSKVCTFEAPDQYYSYRKSAQTGRMATLIWIQP